MDETRVVTVFLRAGTDVLLLRRSDAVGSYPGRWGGVAGHVADHGAPDATAAEEVAEETGLRASVGESGADTADADATLVRRGDPFDVEDPEHGSWRVHPYLLDCREGAREAVATDRETVEHAWVAPTAILERETVPDLWRSWAAVAPTLATVRGDRTHGSAQVSLRALEVLRDAGAAVAAGERVPTARDGEPATDVRDAAGLAALALALRSCRPVMVAVRNRVDRAVADAGRVDSEAEARPTDPAAGVDHADRGADDEPADPGVVADRAAAVLATAADADRTAAVRVAERLAGQRVATLSRSGTVRPALERAGSVLVAASHPGGEGVAVAEALARAGQDVTLAPDAAAPGLVATCDAVLVGADAVGPDGQVLNKVGTYPLALAADRAGVPAYAAAARAKVASEAGWAAATEHAAAEPTDPGAVYAGDAPLEVAEPTFEVTPGDLFAGVVTERGLLDRDGVGEVAAEHAALADWG